MGEPIDPGRMRADDVLPRREVPLGLTSLCLTGLGLVTLGLVTLYGRGFQSSGLLQQSALRVADCRDSYHRALDSFVTPVGIGVGRRRPRGTASRPISPR